MIVKSIQLENNNKLNFHHHPKYASYSVSFDRGGIPAVLEGEFLSLKDLEEKALHYLTIREKNRTKPKKETKDGEEHRDGSQ